MTDMYNTGFDDGRKAARGELAPFVDAIQEAIFMFKDIEKARNIPSVWHQYVVMGNQLERMLSLTGLMGTKQ